jgi:LacI family transcriptional regulator
MKPPRTGPPTIRDVALAAGVSVGTVSKALNQTGALSPDTRQRIIALADTMNFRANAMAKSLQSGLSGTIGLISNDSFGRFTMPIMQGLDQVLAPLGIGVLMANATDDPQAEAAHVRHLMAKQVDGLIVTARRADRRATAHLAGLGVPVIHVFARGAPQDLTFLPDDRGGAVLAVQHLVDIGRRRIAHVTGPADFEAVRLRAEGYAQTLAAANLPPQTPLHGPWSESWGRAAVAQLAQTAPFPDAIFCGNDQIARGAADALRDLGRDVPHDVALVGFDNWHVMALAARPPLTSVDMGLSDLGAEAGRAMARMIAGDTLSGTVLLPCRLVPRASTAHQE